MFKIPLFLQIVSGGYVPPPDYTSIRLFFFGVAITFGLATLSSDMKRNTRFALWGLAGASTVAGFAAIPLVKLSPPIETSLRTVSGNPFTWLVLGVMLFEVVYLAPIVARLRKPTINVVAPLANSWIQPKTVVFGTVHPAYHPVRAMIFSADRRYHRQDAPTIFSPDGTRWSIECQFGLDTTSASQEYEIAAIDGSVEIDAVCDTLPAGIAKSLPVKVRRAG